VTVPVPLEWGMQTELKEVSLEPDRDSRRRRPSTIPPGYSYGPRRRTRAHCRGGGGRRARPRFMLLTSSRRM
jgi:hypothetical protein